MITATDLSLDRGAKNLISASSFTIHPNHKVGLVGSNGCGKSSLFAALLKELSPDAGDLSFPSGWSVATVKQETPSLEQSALDYVMDGATVALTQVISGFEVSVVGKIPSSTAKRIADSVTIVPRTVP